MRFVDTLESLVLHQVTILRVSTSFSPSPISPHEFPQVGTPWSTPALLVAYTFVLDMLLTTHTLKFSSRISAVHIAQWLRTRLEVRSFT